jgi:hypothetical protein
MAASKNKRRVARMEFVACAEEIKYMLSRCCTKKFIHDELTSQGRFSMAYVTFCQTLQQAQKNGFDFSNLFHPSQKSRHTDSPKPPHGETPPPAPKPAQNSGPRIITSNHEPFPNPRKMAVEDGI